MDKIIFLLKLKKKVYFHGATAPSGPRSPHYRGFIITLRHTTLCRTPLYEWSARRRDLYLTTHNTHNRQTSMPPAGFEPAIPTTERPQTHALYRAATGIFKDNMHLKFLFLDSSWNLDPGVFDGLSAWVTVCVVLCFISLVLLVVSSCWQYTVRHKTMMKQCCICKCDC